MNRVLAVSSVALVLALLAPAQAHRSGCHRWHTCPSDTGSYTMGSPVTGSSSSTRPRTSSGGSSTTSSSYAMSDYGMTNTNVNLRSQPNSDAAILATIKKDTMVEIYVCGGKWCKVKVEGKVGHMISKAIDRQ